MTTELIQLSFDKIMQTRAYTTVVLIGQGKKFALYTDPNTGKVLQSYLTGVEKQRPLTHELIDKLLLGLNVRIKQVVINDLQDTVYYARLYLEQDVDGLKHLVEIDSRPSDCITLAIMNNVPVYCTADVLDKSIPLED